MNPSLLFSLPGLGDVVGRLHPHERVHLRAESLLGNRTGETPVRLCSDRAQRQRRHLACVRLRADTLSKRRLQPL
jgi:hypothetical protein